MAKNTTTAHRGQAATDAAKPVRTAGTSGARMTKAQRLARPRAIARTIDDAGMVAGNQPGKKMGAAEVEARMATDPTVAAKPEFTANAPKSGKGKKLVPLIDGHTVKDAAKTAKKDAGEEK